MNEYKYNPIKMTPFKWFVLENFPFIEEDFDSLTSYGLWSKLKEYFDKVATKTNEMGAQVESLTNAFIVLKDYIDNYFKNLDVQEEIDNKLDELVNNGTLTLLINKAISQKIQVSSLGIEPGNVTSEQIDIINNYIEENPYSSLEFGKGVYTLAKPIKLLQGSSISGIGNDTKLKSTNGQWAIICKGLVNINSTTEIYNLTIDGNFEGNGIYIDGSRYSRCEIHDIFIVSCLYGLRNAKPAVDNVYDNNFGIGNGGNNIHDIYIYGETPNDDTSRCIDGLVLIANDNFISNVRVSGFNDYGIYLNGSGNQFSNLKAGVNHIGCRITGGQNFGSICAEESFQNNFELNYVRNSELVLKTASAGCIVSDNLPSNLQYFDVYMEHCSQNNIQISGFVAQSFTYRKAGELAFLNLLNSMLNKIDISFGNSQVPNKYCLPIMSNCAFANDITINTHKTEDFINYNILDDIEVVAPTNINITGDYPEITVQNNSTSIQQNLIGLDLFNYVDDDLIIFDDCFGAYPPQYYQIQYRFNGDTNFNNYSSSSQFVSSYGENGSVIIPINIKEILESLPEYIDGIQQGKTLALARIFLRSSHAKQGQSKHKLKVVKF